MVLYNSSVGSDLFVWILKNYDPWVSLTPWGGKITDLQVKRKIRIPRGYCGSRSRCVVLRSLEFFYVPFALKASGCGSCGNRENVIYFSWNVFYNEWTGGNCAVSENVPYTRESDCSHPPHKTNP